MSATWPSSAAQRRDELHFVNEAALAFSARPCLENELDQSVEALVTFYGVSQGKGAVHLVRIAAALTSARHVARRLQLRHDALNGTLGNAHPFGDVAHSGLWVLHEAEKNV